MQLHEIQSRFKRKKTKRVGRGGKRGTFSGHGTKGQRARAGHRIRPAERDLLARLPKLRGVKNKSLFKKPKVINLDSLSKLFAAGETVDKNALMKKKQIRRVSSLVKIVGDGTMTHAVVVSKIPLSVSAMEKIKKAGGTVI